MTDEVCTCPHGIQSLGRLFNVSMGKGTVRLSTTKNCPVHDACRRFTTEVRSERDNGRWLYCPKHGTKDCPAPRETKD